MIKIVKQNQKYWCCYLDHGKAIFANIFMHRSYNCKEPTPYPHLYHPIGAVVLMEFCLSCIASMGRWLHDVKASGVAIWFMAKSFSMSKQPQDSTKHKGEVVPKHNEPSWLRSPQLLRFPCVMHSLEHWRGPRTTKACACLPITPNYYSARGIQRAYWLGGTHF